MSKRRTKMYYDTHIQAGDIDYNKISRSTRSPSQFIEIKTEDFLNDLGMKYLNGELTSEVFDINDVHGWQIIPDLIKGQLYFIYVPVLKKNGTMKDGIKMVENNYVVVECSDKISKLNIPTLGIPIKENYTGETSIEAIHEKGLIPKSFFESSTNIDFFYLIKDDLFFMLENKPSLLYISKCSLDYGGGIDMEDGQNFQMLKIECKNEEGQIFIKINDKTLNPLYILASPCPPKWNNLFKTNTYEAQIGSSTSLLKDNNSDAKF